MERKMVKQFIIKRKGSEVLKSQERQNQSQNSVKVVLTGFIVALSLVNCVSLKAAKHIEKQNTRLLVRQVAYGHLAARVLHTACYYKLFDTLQDGPKLAEEMVVNTQQSVSTVKRLMRVLANHKVVDMDEKGRFSLNQNSEMLVSTAPNSLQQAFAKEFDLRRWESLGKIHLAMNEDVIPFEQVFHQAWYEYLEGNAEASTLFNKGMKNFSEQEDEQASQISIFKNFKVYCDIGGGTGGLLSQVLHKNPHMKGILFDLPEAVKECTLPNVVKAGGNFFESVPSADIYTVKRVLHNWKDEECIKILTNIAKALSNKTDGRILVLEKVLPQQVDGSFLIDSDIIGLALGGRERTLGEFIKIGQGANLELEDAMILPSGISIMFFKPMK
jgi:hypothetical protein